MSDISQGTHYRLGTGSSHHRSASSSAQMATAAALVFVYIGSQGTRGYVRGQRILAAGIGPVGGPDEPMQSGTGIAGPRDFDATVPTAGWWRRMKRWFAIHFRKWGGKYTSHNAEAWEDWTNNWNAYQAGDPISQMVRGTWQPNRSGSSRNGTWSRENGDQTTTGTWHREDGGPPHGTWTEDDDA
jgi:hypothetical protein